MKVGDSSAYRKFYAFLIRCSSITEGHHWNTLDSPENLCEIVSKLPGSSKDRWNRNVFSVRKNESRELADLIEFVDTETTLENDPLYSREAMSEKSDNKKFEKKEKLVKTFLSKKFHVCSVVCSMS